MTSTKQFVRLGRISFEERDASGALSKKYFAYGQVNASTSYFFCRDHLGSVRLVLDSSGVTQSEHQFEAYGKAIQIQGSMVPDFLYAGYYFHSPSGLSLTGTRAYNPVVGRFISRDSIEERSGTNLFSYVANNPLNLRDPNGTRPSAGGFKCDDGNCYSISEAAIAHITGRHAPMNWDQMAGLQNTSPRSFWDDEIWNNTSLFLSVLEYTVCNGNRGFARSGAGTLNRYFHTEYNVPGVNFGWTGIIVDPVANNPRNIGPTHQVTVFTELIRNAHGAYEILNAYPGGVFTANP